jgi:hypothetical protein
VSAAIDEPAGNGGAKGKGIFVVWVGGKVLYRGTANVKMELCFGITEESII